MNKPEQSMEIITGRYGMGSQEQNKIVETIFGEKCVKRRFEIYFHWYNILHELGHGIMHFNCFNRPHPAAEEQLVNDFAVAYWLHYGEKEKLIELESTLEYALSQVICPAKDGTDYIAYAKEKWGQEELFTFNNYGWFQFNCVASSLQKKSPLNLVLKQMGVENIIEQPQQLLAYTMDSIMPMTIVKDAVPILRKWGGVIPNGSVTYDNDPNRQMCKIIDLQ